MTQNSAPQIPHIDRKDWSQHPNYPRQVLLLGSHENFRLLSAALIEAAESVDAPSELEALYRHWITAMRSHEAYEENKLYPYLSLRWGASFAEAQEGHLALHEKHAGVLAAFSAIRTGELNDVSRTDLVDALKQHHAVLVEHLEHEEDVVIPLLLSLAPEEFRHYSQSSFRTLLRQFEEANDG